MTVLGASQPSQTQFSLGTSSNIAPAKGATFSVDMSLDDMIKTRQTSLRSAAKAKNDVRNASTADKMIAKGRAKRQAAANARRGLQKDKKPTAIEIERETYRQTRKASSNRVSKNQGASSSRAKQDNKKAARPAKKAAAVKTKAKLDKKKKAASGAPPARPPSKKAINAAVKAMTEAGFKIPQGSRMVIQIAPSTNNQQNQKKTAGNAGNKKNPSNNNNNRGGNKKSGGGRGKK